MAAELSNEQSPSTYSSSSRTSDKSKSNISSFKEEEDFTKENKKSPIDLEVSIQTIRITKVFNEAIYKTKLAICLPILMRGNLLFSLLSEEHCEDLKIIYEEYSSDLLSPSLLDMSVLEEMKEGDYTFQNRLNPELGHLMYILLEYPALRPVVEDMMTVLRKGYVSYESKHPKPSLEFLIAMERFRGLMVEKMDLTAAEELVTKLRVRKIEHSNSKLIASINELKAKMKEEKENFTISCADNVNKIAQLERELALLMYSSNDMLKKKILDSDRQMVLKSRKHDVKQELLKEECLLTEQSYATHLKEHMAEEKNLRARKFKCEIQLMSWIQRYDVDMTEKQTQLDQLTEQFEEEEKTCKEIEEKVAEQDKEFVPLMAEREEEYHKEMTDKMTAFLFEHAARVIQMGWRQVLHNRAEKKRLKKQIQKMQEERDAAERREERRLAKLQPPKKGKKKK